MLIMAVAITIAIKLLAIDFEQPFIVKVVTTASFTEVTDGEVEYP